jgi:hypothetical protein
MRGWDANGNGMLDENEINESGRRKYYAERIIRRAGMEPKYPLAIKRVEEGLKKTIPYFESLL